MMIGAPHGTAAVQQAPTCWFEPEKAAARPEWRVMWHVLVWGPVVVLMLLWSALCQALHALLSGVGWGVGAPGAWLRHLEQWQIPASLADWLPMSAITGLKTWLTTWGPWLEDLLTHAPLWLGWLSPLVWLAWAAGMLGLVLVGAVGSVLVKALRGGAGRGGTAAAARAGQQGTQGMGAGTPG